MKRLHLKTIGFTFVFLILFLMPSLSVFAKEVYTVPLEDEVEKGLKEFINRAITEAENNNASALIFEIHTPGGFVDAAGEIAKIFDESSVHTIAFINNKAHSAGAFLALHADKIYMVPNGTIGAAAVITGDGNMADVKANSAWLAAMQVAAESSGRDPKYALAMADARYSLPEYRVQEGDVLTLSAAEALKVGYSDGTASSINEVLKLEGLEGATIVPIKETISEKVARFITNPVVVPILLSIASLGLIIELYSPGFGVPGTMGITALLLFFYGHLVAGLAGYESIVLFVIGIILLIAEIFLPGAIAGILGIAAIVGSIILAGGNVVHMTISVIIAAIVAIIGMVILMKFFGKKLQAFSKIILKDKIDTESGYVSNVNRFELLDRIGITTTPLRPSGTISLDNERIDVVTEGGYVEANMNVKIVKVEGSRIVVRRVEA